MIEARHLITLLLCLSISACVSGPDQASPAAIESADSTQAEGVARYQRHEYQAAYQQFKKALQQYRLLDNPEGIQSSCINIARTLMASDQSSAAREWVRTASSINERYDGYRNAELQQHIELLDASLDKEAGDLVEAKSRLGKILDGTSDTAIRRQALRLRTSIAFIEEDDIEPWLERYSKTVGDKPGHRARLARFRAQRASSNQASADLYRKALEIYRALAHRTGIASTLSEWANLEAKAGGHGSATDKFERALAIRLGLRQASHSKAILEALSESYRSMGENEKQENAEYWHERISRKDFIQWNDVGEDFDRFPSR